MASTYLLTYTSILHFLTDPFVFLAAKLAELLHALLTALEAPFVFLATKLAELLHALLTALESPFAFIAAKLTELPHLFQDLWKLLVTTLETPFVFLASKLAQLPHLFQHLWRLLVTTLEAPFVFLGAKLTELLHTLQKPWNLLETALQTVLCSIQYLWNLLVADLKAAPRVIAKVLAGLVKWLDETFPPEVMRQWVRIGGPILVALLLLALIVYLCIKFPCCVSEAGKMMKAPGQVGVMILRSSFEAAPMIYFQALRATTRAAAVLGASAGAGARASGPLLC